VKPVNVGLLGLGTVGGGTVNVLARNAEEITRRAGRGIRVSHAAAREIKNPDELRLDGVEITDDAFKLVENPDIQIIVELIGGYQPALELVLRAIATASM